MIVQRSSKSVRKRQPASVCVLKGGLYFAPTPAPPPAPVEPAQEQPKSEQAETAVDKSIAA